MKPSKTLLLTTATLWVLTGCCWTDHSETIKEVAEPMLKELKIFYSKHKRFPTTQERNEMLERVGCKMDGDKCLYQNYKIKLNTWFSNYDYKIRMTINNTHGNFNLYKDSGNISDIRFYQKPCIKFGQ